MAFKKFKNWKGALSIFLHPGDYVDKDFVDYFIGIVPPATCTDKLIQIGEPSELVKGKYTYHTLKRTAAGWYYAGCCFKGSEKEVPCIN